MTEHLPAGASSAREIDGALARSILYEALALGFRPPDAETQRRLRRPSEVCFVAAAAALLDPSGEAGLARAVLRLAEVPAAVSLEALRACRERLFGHTTRGALSAYETEYGDDTAFQQPQTLGDLSGFLAAFGLQIDPAGRERVDHVSAECEFMAFLARKEAHALEHDDAEMLLETRRAARAFLRDHLGRFAPALGRLAAREDPDGFYGALADLCRRFVTAECEREGVPAGPEFLPLREPAEDSTPMACGSAEDLVQIRTTAGPDAGGFVPVRKRPAGGGGRP